MVVQTTSHHQTHCITAYYIKLVAYTTISMTTIILQIEHFTHIKGQNMKNIPFLLTLS